MAILENGTKNYFKVDFEHSFVQKNMVFASITIYGAETDRQNEKHRLDEFLAFDENCKRILKELSANEQYAELYASFSKAVRDIEEKRYTNDGLVLPDNSFSQEVTPLLTECGYQPEWISRPICVISKRLVNFGMCGEESLTAEYIYGKIKAKMTPDIRDI